MNQWKSFEEIFNINKAEMLQTGNTGEDVGRIWNAVLDAAKNIGVEERVIFCIVWLPFFFKVFPSPRILGI